MKKSSKLFSFIAVVLCAFLLFGSVGSFQKVEQTAEAASGTYEKIVSLDSLKNLTVNSGTNYYIEYGEYPQSELSSSASSKIKELINHEFYGETLPSQVSDIYQERVNGYASSKCDYFTYNSENGYFTANVNIYSDTTKTNAGGNGSATLYLKAGEKVYEYISGVNAQEKYPVYMLDSNGTNMIGESKSSSIRSASIETKLDSVTAGNYYGTSPNLTKCDCAYCGGSCHTSNTVKTGNNGGTSTNSSRLKNYSMTYPSAYGSNYTVNPSSTSWLRGSDYATFNTELDGYLSHSSLVDKGYYFTFHNGNLTPLSIGDDGRWWYAVSTDTNGWSWDSDSDEKLAKKLYSEAKSKMGITSDKQIYQLQVYQIDDIRDTFLGFYTNSNYRYHVRVWAMADSASCAYCVANHNKGNAPESISNHTIYGKQAVDTSNGYSNGSQYYFKVEPIKWRIVKNNSGIFTLQSDMILDSMYYNLYSSNGTNFMTSYLRNWLNNGFEVQTSSTEVDRFEGAYYVLKDGLTSNGSVGTRETAVNSTGKYNGVDTYSGTGNSKKLNADSYKYIKGQYTTLNVEAYQSDITGYSNDKPTFFKMAFSNEDTSIMKTVGQGEYTGYKGFDGNSFKVTPGSADASGMGYSKNYVTIPYSAGAAVKGGNKATGFGRVNSQVYTPFAVATGLVKGWGDSLNLTEVTPSTNLNYGSGSNVLLWTESNSESPKNGTARKDMAIISNVDGTSSAFSNFGTSLFTMVNQSAGVAPIISIDITQIKDVLFVTDKLATASTAGAQDVASLENGALIKTVTRSKTTVERTDARIDSYIANANTSQLEVSLAIDSNYRDTVDYIKFVIAEGFEAVDHDTSIDTDPILYYPSEANYKYYAVNLTDRDIQNGICTFTLSNVPNLNNKDKFNIRAYMVTNNGTVETMLEDSEIHTASVSISSNKDAIFGPSGTYFEGEIVTFEIKAADDGIVYPLYFDNAFTEVAIENAGMNISGTGTEKQGTVRLQYLRDGNWYNLKDNSVVKTTNSLNLYAKQDIAEYSVSFGTCSEGGESIPQSLTDIMIIEANGKTIEASSGSPIIIGLGGYDVNFRVYIKNSYVKQFNTVGDLVWDGSSDEQGFFSFDIFGITGNNIFATNSEGMFTKTTNTNNGVEVVEYKVDSEVLGYIDEYAKISLTITGPEVTILDNSNGVIDMKYYDIKISGVGEGYGNENGDYYESVKLNMWTHNATNATYKNFTTIEQDTYDMNIDPPSNKVTFAKGTSTTGETTVPIRSSEYTLTNVLYNSELNADIKFNTGYSLHVDSFRGNRIIMPEMTFSYATQVLDSNGFRLSEDKKYGNGQGVYSGSNVRLDPLGNPLTFDDNSNMKYQIARLDGTGNEAAQVSENYQGVYWNEPSAKDSYNYTVPILKLHVEEKMNPVKGDVVLIPKIVVSQDFDYNGTHFDKDSELYFNQSGLYSFIKYGKLKFNVHLKQADLEDPTGGDYIYLKNIFTENAENIIELGYNLTTDGQPIAPDKSNLDRVNNLKNYYMDHYGYESVEDYIDSFVNNNLKTLNISYEGVAYNTGIVFSNSEIQPGKMEQWGIFRHFIGDRGEDTTQPLMVLPISRNTSVINRQTRTNSYGVSYYLNAHYADYTYNAAGVTLNALFTNLNKYVYDYSGPTKAAGNTNKLSMYPQSYDSASTAYNPWIIYTTTTLGGQTGIGSIKDGYTSYSVSSGKTSGAWNNMYRQFFALNKTTGKAELLNYDGMYPTYKVGGKSYLAAPDATGMYQLYEKKGDDPDKTKPLINSNYVISYAQPITATLYTVNSNTIDGEGNPIASFNGSEIESYNAGDTFIRLTVHNVVSDIKFTLNESSISEYAYPVEFYSNFGHTDASGAGDQTSFLFDSFVLGNGTIDGMTDTLTEQLENMITTISGDVLKFKPYVVNNGTNKNYYFMAPIANVTQSEESNDLGIRYENGEYFVGEVLLTDISSDSSKTIMTANGNNYFFTDKIYRFTGWKFMHKDGVSEKKFVAGSPAETTLWGGVGGTTLQTVSNETLAETIFRFTNTNCEVHLMAQYEELDLNVEFYSWNMCEDTEASGLYNVIEEYYKSLGDDKVPFGTNGFKYESGSYSLKGIKLLDKFDYSNSTQKTYIESTMSAMRFAEGAADSYGFDKGWFRKLSDAEAYVEESILQVNLEEIANITLVKQALANLGYNETFIWNNRAFFKNNAETIYFSIVQNGADYVVEGYIRFNFETDIFTDNAQLYKIYEVASKTVTLTGMNDLYDSLLSTDTTPSTIRVGENFTTTMRLDDAYSRALEGTQADPRLNITNFVKRLNITATVRRLVTEDSYIINYVGESATPVWNVDEAGNFIYYFATNYVAEGEGEVIGYIMIDRFYREITISIDGVISNVVITSAYQFTKNVYTVKLYNPAFDNDGQPVVNGENQALKYGTFVLRDEDGNVIKNTASGNEISIGFVAFDEGDSISFLLNGEECTIKYSQDFKEAIITVPYGTNVYFDFVRNEAFSQYIDADAANMRPVEVHYTTADEEGNDVPATSEFVLYSFESVDSNILYRYTEDTATEGANKALSKYAVMNVTQNYEIKWKDITINTYALTTNPANADYYQAYITDGAVDEGAIVETPLTDNKAMHNQNVDVVFEMKDAYTQTHYNGLTKFIPMLQLKNGLDLILFAHMYEIGEGNSTPVYINAGGVNVQLSRQAANGGTGRPALYQYTYTYNLVAGIYRVYAEAETSGEFKGYYRVTKVADDTVTYDVEKANHTLGYINYDELNYKYYFKNLNTVETIYADLACYYWSGTATEIWNANNKNKYDIVIDKSVSENAAYAFTAYTVEGGSFAAASINKNSNEKTIADSDTETDGLQYTGLQHGTKLRFRITMNDAYTHTIPLLNFNIVARNSKIDGSEIQAAINELFKFDVRSTYETKSNWNYRTNSLIVGNLEFTVTQIFQLDTRFNTWSAFVEQAGLVELDGGFNVKENLMYLDDVTYVLDITLTDSFTLTNVYDDPSTTDVEASYAINTYHIIFNKWVSSDTSQKDHGPLTFVSEGNATLGYEEGKTYYYYQTVLHGANAVNPFTTEGLLAPDGKTTINANTFKTAEIEGYTYAATEGNDNPFTTNGTTPFLFNSGILGHNVLYAPFTEETYNVKIELPAENTAQDLPVAYKKYAEVQYKAAKGAYSSNLTSANNIVTGTTLKYTATTFSVKYIMYSAYDHSSMRFIISNYGELKMVGDSGVTGGNFTNNVNGVNKNLNFVIDNSVPGKTVYSYYYNITTLIAKVTIDETVKATGSSKANRDYVNSTIYELEIVKPIDAGNDINVANPGSIVISTRFVANTNANLTDSATGLNKYAINLFKAEFTQHDTYPTVNGVEDRNSYGVQSYKTYNGWINGEYPTESPDNVEYIVHGKSYTNSFEHDVVTGYNFTGWCLETNSSATVTSEGTITAIYDDYYLYAKYTVTTGHSIVPFLDQSYSDELVAEMVANPNTVSYGQDATVTFVLGPAYTDNANFLFSTSNSIIKSVSYEKGVYTIVLGYISGKVDIGIKTGQTVLENKYQVSFFDMAYDSTYTTEWLETIETPINKVWNTSTGQPDTQDINETTNVLTDIMHGRTLSATAFTGIDLTVSNLTGFVNTSKMLYVIYDENFDFELDLPALIKEILDGADPTEDYIYAKNEINRYVVGIFDKNTPIEGDMYVFPYYTRQAIKITLTEAIEGSVTSSSILDAEQVTYTYNVPYGYPIISDALLAYDADTYGEIVNTDSTARAYTAGNSNVPYTFDNYYLTSIEAGHEKTLATSIAYTDATFYLNFIRKTYTVTLHKAWDDETVLGTMQIKYGDGFTNDTEISSSNYSTVGDLLSGEIHAGNGQYLSGWTLSSGDEESTPERILSDCKFYPNILYNQYEVAVVEGAGFTQYSFQDGDILVDQEIPSYSNGYFLFSHDSELTIKFTHDTGWTAVPYLTYTLIRDGQPDVTYEDTNWLGSVGSVLTGSLYTITIKNLNHRVLKNADKVIITVNQSISSYTLDIDNSSLDNIEVNKAGRFVYEFDADVLGYVYEGNPVLWFVYDEFVDYGATFTFTVRVAQKYARSSKFAFTLAAGANSATYTLLDATRVGGTIYDEFTFTLNNITQNIIITVDVANSEIVASQFKITYNYAFGGGVNGWNTTVKQSSYAVVENRNEGLLPVEGQTIQAPQAVETTYSANYTLHGTNWYVLKTGGHNGVNLDTITRFNIDEYFEIFDINSYEFVENINVYSFYLVGYFEVTPETVISEKGNLELPQIQENGTTKYHADKKTDDITFAQGYTFSYTLDSKYSQNVPVISIERGTTGTDLIIISLDMLNTVTKVNKSETVAYAITRNNEGYTYAVTSALGAGETSLYSVVISEGVYTVSQDGIVVATASIDENLKHTITLSTVNDTFAIKVNDELFELNAYGIEFKHGNGNVEVIYVNYGNKLTTIPTDEKNFIQKLVYVVTFEDGTVKKMSGKELAKLEITENLTIEIQVAINLVLLIPIVVGAVAIVVAIIVVIVKASQNSGHRRSSGRSNMEAFDKLNQNKPSSDASKKSDKPYNPYIDNSKK